MTKKGVIFQKKKKSEADTGEIDWVWPVTGHLFKKNGGYTNPENSRTNKKSSHVP